MKALQALGGLAAMIVLAGLIGAAVQINHPEIHLAWLTALLVGAAVGVVVGLIVLLSP